MQSPPRPRSQLVNIPLHALELDFSRRDEVANMREILDGPVAFELSTGVRDRLAAPVASGDAVHAAQDVAPQGEDALALDEVFE